MPIVVLALAHPAAVHAERSSADTSHVLPFAGNPIPVKYPALAVAIGGAAYFSSFKGVTDAFHVIEDSIRTATGFDVPPAGHVEPGGVVLLTVDLMLHPAVDLACQVGKSSDSKNELRFIGGLASWRYTLPMAPNVSLLAGLGGGAYGFRFERVYSTQITPFDPGGGYTTLDYIRLEGGGGYWTAAGRVAVRPHPRLTFEAIVQYFGMDDVSMDAGSAGRVSANVSGTMLGGSFMVTF